MYGPVLEVAGVKLKYHAVCENDLYAYTIPLSILIEGICSAIICATTWECASTPVGSPPAYTKQNRARDRDMR